MMFCHSIGQLGKFANRDLHFGAVKVLMHLNGANAGTSFPDVKGHTTSAIGNGQTSTAQSKFNGSSYLGDGTGDGVNVTVNTDLQFGSGDFTIECYVRPTSLAVKALLNTYAATNATSGFVMQLNDTSGHIAQAIYSGSSGFTSNDSTGISSGNFYHLAMCRDGNTLRLYLEGIQRSTKDVTGVTMNSVTTPFYVGIENGSAVSFNGHIAEVRATSFCRYPGGTTFQVPSMPWPNL